MSTRTPDSAEEVALDLRGHLCPVNFVRAKLQLERMAPGQILSVRVDAGEPCRNVPRSLTLEGHEVLGEVVHDEDESMTFRIRNRRAPPGTAG